MHSNDKYFYRSDGYEKNRESVIVATNDNNEVALVKLTTSNTPKYKVVPDYKNSRYMTEDIYTTDNENKRIQVCDATKISNEAKFIPSKFEDIPSSSVESIKETLINDSKYGYRNKQRLEQLKKPRN